MANEGVAAQQNTNRLFLSYCFDDASFAQSINYYLCSQSSLTVFYWDQSGPDPDVDLATQIADEVASSDACVVVLGPRLGDYQADEVRVARENGVRRIVVRPDEREIPKAMAIPLADRADVMLDQDWTGRDADIRTLAHEAAEQIVLQLGTSWVDPLGIPIGYPFGYEKDIVDAYVKGDQEAEPCRPSPEQVRMGCPATWPDVERIAPGDNGAGAPVYSELPENVQSRVGRFREHDEWIAVDARKKVLAGVEDGCAGVLDCDLVFPEAGPRRYHCFPRNPTSTLNVGIIVSGGIAPGINAVIGGIIERHRLYALDEDQGGANAYSLRVHGCIGGLQELSTDGCPMSCLYNYSAPTGVESYRPDLAQGSLNRHTLEGGSILATSRADQLMDPVCRVAQVDQIIDNLQAQQLDIAYIIGGDGSMRAAHCIWRRAQDNGVPLSVVGVPKTTDNDILWVWQSFGFLSGVEKARQEILNLRTEARSNPRLGVIQLFGSDSGFVVNHAALGSGACDLALIPEVPFSMEGISKYIRSLLQRRDVPAGPDMALPWGIVVMAETAIPQDVHAYIDEDWVGLTDDEKAAIRKFMADGQRVRGQTPDELRSGGLKVVSRGLEHDIRHRLWPGFRVFTNEPRHLLRSIEPSLQDLVFGQRLGTLAVDNALAGYTDFMISHWLTEYVLVPLRLVILGRKRVPPEGVFWKSVLAATGQPADLD